MLSVGVVCGFPRIASAQTTTRVTVIVDGASIWSAPSVPSIVLATVKAGTTLDALDQVGSWYRVRLPADATRVGYILVRQVRLGASGAPIPPSSPRSPQPRNPQQRPGARRGPPRRAFVSVSAGYQPSVLTFDNKTTFTDFVEDGSRTTTYDTARVAGIDFGAGAEIVRGLFVGASGSRFSGSVDAEIDEQVPHPFFFNQPRTLKGTSTALPRDEMALHLQVGSLATFGKHLQIFISFGPSFFKLKQTFVTDVTYTQEYPYDSVTFQSARTEQQEKTRVGANAQANVVVMMSRNLGVDGLIRFSHASMSFAGSDGSTFKVPVGGMHVGIGLRAEF